MRQAGGPERPGIVFKTWQIFAFSLLPLALIFAGVVIASMRGADSEPEPVPTPAPQSTPSARLIHDPPRSSLLVLREADPAATGAWLAVPEEAEGLDYLKEPTTHALSRGIHPAA